MYSLASPRTGVLPGTTHCPPVRTFSGSPSFRNFPEHAVRPNFAGRIAGAIDRHRSCTAACVGSMLTGSGRTKMSHRILAVIGLLGALAVVSPAAHAQAPLTKPLVERTEIPRNLRPPPGMCRVWIDKVPATQQPAPTDCASAIRNKPTNGRVIFSEDSTRKSRPKADGKADDRPKGKKPPR